MTDNIPDNVDAERATLGSLLIDQDAIWQVRNVLTGPESFMRDDHAWIYEAIYSIVSSGSAIDFVTVCNALESAGRLKSIGDSNGKGAAYITFLLNCVPTAIHAEHYARIVEAKHQSRQLIKAAGQIAKSAYSAEDPITAHAAALESLYKIAPHQSTPGPRTMNAIVDTNIATMQQMLEGDVGGLGVSTGFTDIDRAWGKMQPGKLIVIAARPSIGKTALCESIAYNAATSGANVVFFSAEMAEEELLLRTACRVAKVDSAVMRAGRLSEEDRQGIDRIWYAMREIQALPLWVDDEPGISTPVIRMRLAQFALRQKLDLVIVDYLQRLGDEGNGNETLRVGKAAQALKNVARIFDVPVIAVSQLSRACESRNPPIPRLSDLRSSGDIEQEADVVTFLFRWDYYADQGILPPKPEEYNICRFHVAKNRSGPTGVKKLVFIKEHTLFLDAARIAEALEQNQSNGTWEDWIHDNAQDEQV